MPFTNCLILTIFFLFFIHFRKLLFCSSFEGLTLALAAASCACPLIGCLLLPLPPRQLASCACLLAYFLLCLPLADFWTYAILQLRNAQFFCSILEIQHFFGHSPTLLAQKVQKCPSSCQYREFCLEKLDISITFFLYMSKEKLTPPSLLNLQAVIRIP